MLEQDFIMRDIETLTLSIARFVFSKETPYYEPCGDETWDGLALRLTAMVDRGELNEAENLLFEAMEEDGRAFELAVDFYSKLNHMSDETLKGNSFTRKEVEDGLHEAMERYDIVLP